MRRPVLTLLTNILCVSSLFCGVPSLNCRAYNSDYIMGDVNNDGDFNVSDVVLLQKWLLAVPNTKLANWKAANFCEDDRLDVFDLCLMKRKLIEKLPSNTDLPQKHMIQSPAWYTNIGGAAALNEQLDIPSREYEKYYRINDIYNMQSNETLSIISNYETYQQTTDYTCGVSNIIMLMQHYGVYDETLYDELSLAKYTGTTEENGVSAQALGRYLSTIGWNVEVSKWNNMIFDYNLDYGYAIDQFSEWVISNIRNDQPIMVDWNDWGGHWQTIIGYDTMGTGDKSDDVLIFADPYDTTDHYQDGYYVFSASRFLKMWTDPSVDVVGGCKQQYVIAYPEKKVNRSKLTPPAAPFLQECFPEKHIIGYPSWYNSFGGAAWQNGYLDMDKNSSSVFQYYIAPDFYDMVSDDHLTIIPHYKTYQQTTDYTCGVCNVIMVMEHYLDLGANEYDEMILAERTGTKDGNGVSAQNLCDYLRKYNYMTIVSDWDCMSFDFYDNSFGSTMERFKAETIERLKSNVPIMVDWNDWGGHWQTIIGYDTMGTEDTSDDVLIFADPYDTTDHYQDGYYVFSASRFLKMWADSSVDVIGGSKQQYLMFYP